MAGLWSVIVMYRPICCWMFLVLQLLQPLSCEISLAGIASDMFDLLSYDPNASCEQYEPYLCGSQYTPSVNSFPTDLSVSNQCITELTCPSIQQSYNSSCLINTPPSITYQFVHTAIGETSFKYRFSWPKLPESCNVKYYLAIFSENMPSNDTCDGYKDTTFCFSKNITDINDEELFIPFAGFRKPSSDSNGDELIRYFKLIAYPAYEWPTITFQIPGYCTKERFVFKYNAIGCQTCNGGCTVNSTAPENFEVSYNFTPDPLSVNVSWNTNNLATRYYLHINSTETHMLYWINNTVSQVTIIDLVNDEQYEVWLEQYSCGCSESTVKHTLQTYEEGFGPDPVTDTSNSTTHTTSDPTTHIVLDPSTQIPSYLTIQLSADPTTQITSDPSTQIPSYLTIQLSADPTTQITSDPSTQTIPLSLIPTPTSINSDKSNTRIYIIISPVIVGFLILAIIVFIVTVLLIRNRRLPNICSCYYNPKPVIQPETPTHRPSNNNLPTKVMLIYSTQTKEKKLLDILTFLDCDLGSLVDENGNKLFHICKYDTSTERDHPSEWLDKHYKTSDYIICVVGKKFRREWNDDIRPAMPLVYAFHQLFNSSFTTSTNPVNKIIIVLRNTPQDDKHIPSQYLQGRRRFGLDDIEGLAGYMLGRPRHVFLGDNAV